jgi:hypothetical protein
METRSSGGRGAGVPASAIRRRQFLQGAGAFGLLAFVPTARLARLMRPALPPGAAGRFLTARELDTLRAVCRRLIPGPPDDPDPGAAEAGVAEAIDLLLGAFSLEPPLIHAGGPFSNRAGATHDDFADFVPFDAQAELGWRIRIEGSLGLPEREFAGPVVGLQQVYREGLAHLDQVARSVFGTPFAAVPGPGQDGLLSDPNDADTQAFRTVAFANSLEAMYGPPEYGGNRSLAGWGYTRWPGDRQPRGYRDVEVTEKDPAVPAAALVEYTVEPTPSAAAAGSLPAGSRPPWPGPSGSL